jgi:hypothetical protein
VARYITFLARFDFDICHLPGKKNTVADALSRRSDHMPSEGEEVKAVPLPDHLFIRLIRPMAVEEEIRRQQKREENAAILEEWKAKYDIQKKRGYYWHQQAIVVPRPEQIQKSLLEIYHDGPTAGHPG